MALELRLNREYCDRDLPPTSTLAWICTYECTFCSDCVLLDSHTVIAGRISAVACVGCTFGFHLLSPTTAIPLSAQIDPAPKFFSMFAGGAERKYWHGSIRQLSKALRKIYARREPFSD
jgi:hypothetical protein